MEMEYYPENNLIVLLLLTILTSGLYLFWWIGKVSKTFSDNPKSNIMLIIFTCGVWYLYLSLKYIQKSEQLNGRDTKWYMIFFLPISFLIIQNNINERYFPGR
jgi:hypothetical protein